jgi:hypothetical protein
LTREWAEGHSLTGRAARTDDRFIGVELFQIEKYDPELDANKTDPLQIALGLLGGHVAPAAEKHAIATTV